MVFSIRREEVGFQTEERGGRESFDFEQESGEGTNIHANFCTEV
jgi:hypothetical protein